MATTTYELTAKYMTERDGIDQALKDAKRHLRREERHKETPFWRYVVVIIQSLNEGAV